MAPVLRKRQASSGTTVSLSTRAPVKKRAQQFYGIGIVKKLRPSTFKEFAPYEVYEDKQVGVQKCCVWHLGNLLGALKKRMVEPESFRNR